MKAWETTWPLQIYPETVVEVDAASGCHENSQAVTAVAVPKNYTTMSSVFGAENSGSNFSASLTNWNFSAAAAVASSNIEGHLLTEM